MSIDNKMVGQISYLARIKMGEEEISTMAEDLNGIMCMVEKLNTLDTDNVEPFTTPVVFPSHHRQDIINDGNIQDKALSNAKDAMNGFYTVPKVVE